MRYKGISFDDLSVQMGTSAKMLELHYSHFTVSDNPNKFAGHEQRTTKEKQKADEENNLLVRQLVEQNAKQASQIQKLLEQLINKQ